MSGVFEELFSPRRVGVMTVVTLFVVVLGGIRAATEGDIVIAPFTLAVTIAFVFVWLFFAVTALQVLGELKESDCSQESNSSFFGTFFGTSFDSATVAIAMLVAVLFAGQLTTQVFASGRLDPGDILFSVLMWALTAAVMIGIARAYFALRR